MTKRKKKKEEDKIVKWLKFLAILCIIILVIEGIFIGCKIYQREKNSVYIDTFGSVISTTGGYVGVGSSDFKRSKKNDYSKDYEKAKIVKYNEEKDIILEIAYKKGYNSYFYDVEKTKDGYIAVGAAAYSKEQVKENTTDGLLVLYDNNLKQLKTKSLQILGDTTFTKVVVLDDGYLVLGQSILENMTIGNDPNGGGIMIKYDFDLKEQWRVNHGGSKSGIFNDCVIVDDAIYLVGKDATRYGVFAKYQLDGTKEFVKNYEYTDTVGFSSIAKVGDNFAVVGGKTINIDAEDKDKVTEAVLVFYDKEGNVISEKTYPKNSSARFNKVVASENNVIAIGHTAKKDEDESTDALNVFRYSGLIAKYTKDGEEIFKKEEKGSRDTYFSDILVSDGTYLVVGQTSSKELGGNNKDLTSYFLTYSKKGKKISSETIFKKVVWDK